MRKQLTESEQKRPLSVQRIKTTHGDNWDGQWCHLHKLDGFSGPKHLTRTKGGRRARSDFIFGLTFIGGRFLCSQFGGSFCAISISVIPKLQISALGPCPLESRVSGAIQNTEPITVVLSRPSADVPKSAILTSPLLVNSKLPA